MVEEFWTLYAILVYSLKCIALGPRYTTAILSIFWANDYFLRSNRYSINLRGLTYTVQPCLKSQRESVLVSKIMIDRLFADLIRMATSGGPKSSLFFTASIAV